MTMATEERGTGLPQLALTFDDSARSDPLIRRSALAATRPDSPRPARFRTTARDPRRITKAAEHQARLVEGAAACKPCMVAPHDRVPTRERLRSNARVSLAGGHSNESTAMPPHWHQASSISEPERLRRLPSFSRAPSWGTELKGAAAPRPTHGYFTRTASTEMAAQLGEMGI
jgi:hypothetical protein